ncbi:MAG: DNA phosphorothioation-associated protein 4 [Syntrophaceae bacterium]|nr:DNA phosphorothioation-associated protein 4 [Syntrophaceae bacterium]
MRRVQRDSTKETFIQEMCDSKTGYFSEIWRLLLFAALLGRAKGRREPLKVVPKETIRQEVFSNSPLWPGLIHLIGVTESKDADCLRSCNWDNSLRLFEEYANGGLSILAETLDVRSIHITSLVEYLVEETQANVVSNNDDISSVRI